MRRWQRQIVPRSVDGPLVPFLKTYAAFLNDEGYSHESFLVKTRVVMRFSQWLKRRHVGIRDLTVQYAEEFWRVDSRCRVGVPRTLKEFLGWLQGKGILSSQACRAHEMSSVDLLVEEYTSYLRQERGLAGTSIEQYESLVRRFLNASCPSGRHGLHSLSPQGIWAFVQNQARRYRTSKAASLLTVSVRSFLRFARYRGYIERDLAAVVPAVARWSLAPIPKCLPLKYVRQVLRDSERRCSPDGLRDRAVLLLLARLGLRAREVMLLELDDIDWPNSALYVCGKGRQERPLPLPHDVGEAIAAYLRAGRPASSCRRVFLRARAPWRGLAGSGEISAIVERALKRARIKSATYGAHQFRHALATNMLRRGLSLTEIGQVLRHRSPDTTRIYAKVDFGTLRKIAQPWPERPR